MMCMLHILLILLPELIRLTAMVTCKVREYRAAKRVVI